MAGDWLKISVDLPEKPEVWQIAGMVGIDADCVVGKLIKVWRWFDAHTESGNAVGVTYALVDHVSGVTGFAEAMAMCGWLEQNGVMLSLPHFDRHNGKTAKNRILTAKRVALHKSKSNGKGNDAIVSNALPRGEESRDIKALEQQAARKTANRFDEFWQAYPVKKGRAAAEAKWKAKGYDKIADTIIADVKKRCAEDRQWLDGYAPHGSTYVNGRGWEDGIERKRETTQAMPDHMVGAL